MVFLLQMLPMRGLQMILIISNPVAVHLQLPHEKYSYKMKKYFEELITDLTKSDETMLHQIIYDPI